MRDSKKNSTKRTLCIWKIQISHANHGKISFSPQNFLNFPSFFQGIFHRTTKRLLLTLNIARSSKISLQVFFLVIGRKKRVISHKTTSQKKTKKEGESWWKKSLTVIDVELPVIFKVIFQKFIVICYCFTGR